MKRCMWTAAVLIAAALLAPGVLRGESGPASPPDVVVGQSDDSSLAHTRRRPAGQTPDGSASRHGRSETAGPAGR